MLWWRPVVVLLVAMVAVVGGVDVAISGVALVLRRSVASSNAVVCRLVIIGSVGTHSVGPGSKQCMIVRGSGSRGSGGEVGLIV